MKLLILLTGLFASGCAVVPVPAYNYGGVQADIYPDVYVAPRVYTPNPVIISNNYIAPRRPYNYQHPIYPPRIGPPHYRSPHVSPPIHRQYFGSRPGPTRINRGFR